MFVQNYTLVVGVLMSSTRTFIRNIHPCAYKDENLMPHSKCEYPGFFVEAIATQLWNAGVHYVVKQIPKSQSSIKNRYELMLNGTVDMFASNHWFITQERKDMGFQFSFPTETHPLYSALLKDTARDDMLKSVETYSTQIFKPAVLLCMVLVYVLYWLYKLLPLQFKIRLLPMILYLCAALALGFYANRLLVNLLRHTKKPLFTDFDTMLDEMRAGRVRMTRTATTGWYAPFINRTDIVYSKRFVETIVGNQPVVAGRKLIDSLVESGAHFELKTSAVAQWKASVGCSLMVVDMPEFGPLLIGIMFSPKTPKRIIDRINEGISWTYSYKRYLYDKYLAHARRQAQVSCTKRKTTHKIIDIPSVMCIFSALAIGLSFAALYCLGEKFHYIFKNRRKYHCPDGKKIVIKISDTESMSHTFE